jgi:L-ascorbate metabolism protein UlaG (beta-lactamase superfamily)
MKLKWYGHASFRLTSQNGVSVITDPSNPETSGYKPFTEPSDIVIISSDNDLYHCNEHLIPGTHITINALELAQRDGVRLERGIEFRAIEAMEALNHNEHNPDQNGMYRINMDGIHIGHMGDIGNALTPAQLEFFEGIDVLLALVGGHPTLELNDLQALIEHVKPKLIIPMHFRTLTYKPRNTFWITNFLEYFNDNDVDFACSSEFEITKETLPTQTRVMVMDYV